MGKGQTSWTSSWGTLARVTRPTAPQDITLWGLGPPRFIIVRWRSSNPTNIHSGGWGGKKEKKRTVPRPAPPAPPRPLSSRPGPPPPPGSDRAPGAPLRRPRPPASPSARGGAGPSPAHRPRARCPRPLPAARRLPLPARRARSMAAQEWDWFQREELIGQISDIRVQNLQGTAARASPEGPPPPNVGPAAFFARPGAGCRWPGPGLQSSRGGAVRGRECVHACVCTRTCAPHSM